MSQPSPSDFITGEWKRVMDDRYRVTLPSEVATWVTDEAGDTILSKERPGCLSLWRAAEWQAREEAGISLIRQKIQAGRLEQRWTDVQRMGRLLSTRSRTVRLANRSRLVIPEGFREFLEAPPEGEIIVVGAVICLELWNPRHWLEHLRQEMPDFGTLFRQLSD